MTKQIDIFEAIAEGERLRDLGLKQAVDHAQKEIPNWKERVWILFQEWLQRLPVGYKFLIEDFRLYLECQGKIDPPPSDRAYGFIPKRAAKEGLIIQAGTGQVKNPLAHRANAGKWEKI